MMSPQQEAQAIITEYVKLVGNKELAIKLALNKLDYTLNAFDLVSSDISYGRDYYVEVQRAISNEIMVNDMNKIDRLVDELQFLVTHNNSGWDLKLTALEFTLKEYIKFREIEELNK